MAGGVGGRGGFPPFINELRRLGGELVMAARYPALGEYRAELEQMGQRLLVIVDELMAQAQLNPQIGLPPQAEGAIPGEVPIPGPQAMPPGGGAVPPDEAAVAELLKGLGGIPV